MIKKNSVYKARKENENKKVYLNWPNLNSDNKAIRYSGWVCQWLDNPPLTRVLGNLTNHAHNCIWLIN